MISLFVCVCCLRLVANSLRLDAGAEKKHTSSILAQLQAKPLDVAKLQNKSINQAVFAKKIVQMLSFSTKPALTSNRCCAFVFYAEIGLTLICPPTALKTFIIVEN